MQGVKLKMFWGCESYRDHISPDSRWNRAVGHYSVATMFLGRILCLPGVLPGQGCALGPISATCVLVTALSQGYDNVCCVC